MTIEPDQLIDNRYKVIKHLGQGGMGTVWKAVDQQAGGDVVIKMPLDDSNPVILQRFGNEARMMRQHSMGNQSILDIQGMGDIDGVPYYVMRFLSGGSLEDRCPIVDEQGQPDFRSESYEWLTTIAKALDFLHSKDVLHRDVKPGNILFNESGDAYLVDFGIVKSPLEASSFTSAPTAANTSPGTIEYMPPEVLAGEVDAISGLGDQYALAVTLYEMIAGQRPFTGPTETAIYRAIEKGANSLAEVKAGIPPAAAVVVSRALNSDPSKRFTTCREFATAFDSALRSKSVSSFGTSGTVEDPSEAQTGMVPIGGSEIATPVRGGVAVAEPSGGSDSLSIADSFKPAVPVERSSVETGPNGQRQVGGKRIWLGVVAFAGIIGFLLLGGGIFAAMNVDFTGNGSVTQVDKQPAELLAAEEARQKEAKRKEEAEARELEEADRLAKEEADRLAKAKEVEEAARLAEAKAKEEADKLAKEKEKVAQQKQREADQARLAAEVRLTAPFGRTEIETALTGLNRMNGLKPEITNSIGMKLRLIPAGTFLMGSPPSEPRRSDDELQHEVRISSEFYLGATEVTQGQWKSVMYTEPWKGEGYAKEGKNYAASYISWDDAVKFCEKLSVRDGVKYRLPTEAEWEYACRGGAETAYSFGNDRSELGKYAWFEENADKIGEEYAHEVGLKLGNVFGLHDMHGNVWEWCSDNYGKDYYGASPRTDPQGPNDDTNRVGRGGSWGGSARYCRSADRSRDSPDSRDDSLGFRVLRSSIK